MPPLPPQPTGSEAARSAGAASGAISFEVLAEIAAGATARVDLCRVLSTGSAPPSSGVGPVPPMPRPGALVAVKRLHPHVAEDPTFVKQFLDEVRFTYWLRHPNVVEVAGWGTDGEGSYLAVELVQGVSLIRLMKTIFDTGEAFTERMVVYIASRICWGLTAAHSLRAPDGEMLHLVHRDLTPSNVLVGFNGEVKITDFGMAKAKQRLTKTLTGMKKGEPTYMAPEQARSDEIDARADLFSLGVMLFELFAGRRPWIAKSDYEMVQITTREPPADLRELRPKIDRELVNVVNRCLEREPAARYQSAREIAGRLDEWLEVHGYQEDNEEALGRFVRRNAMRQMRWFERAIAGDLSPQKVERDPHPRVPTYTEHTRPRSEPPAAQVPSPARPGPQKPLVPPRPGGAPADPRSIRAANVVQQLKKLAPPVEPPRGRHRRTPTLDEEDSDATDVELRIGARASLSQPDTDDDDPTGEEAPTLVQKGDDKVQALRAEARAKRAGAAPVTMGETPKPPAQPAPKHPLSTRPPSIPGQLPSLIVDEDSDQRITEVKREAQRRAAERAGIQAPGMIADPESDLPTAPLAQGRRETPKTPPQAFTMGETPRPLHDPSEAPTPIASQHARTTPVNLGTPVDAPQRSRKRSDAGPQMRAIPRSPDVPPRPFPTATSTRATQPAMRAVLPPAPQVPSGRPPGQEYPEPTPIIAPPSDPSRVSHSDDVQVIDRSALQQRNKPMTEDGLLAEADRLAIEAVRRNEEARAAQLRAERKTAAARLAGDAAAIAAEAVRMVKTAGLAAAVQRLEEARTLDANIQSGKIPVGDPAAMLRSGVAGFAGAGPVSSPTDSRPLVETALGATTPAPNPAPRPPAEASGPAYLSTGTPSSVPIFAGAAADPPAAVRPSYVPPAPDVRPSVPPAHGLAAPPGPAHPGLGGPADQDAFRARLRPSLLGTPSGALVALALVGLGVVVTLVLLLAK